MSQLEQPARRGVVAIIQRAGRLLVIRRSALVVAPLAYCFPGGGIEGDESELEALVRELREELNIAGTPLERVYSSVTPWRVALAWWKVDLAEEAVPRPNPAEVESCVWLTLEEMLELPGLLESNREFLQKVLAGGLKI